MFADAGRDCRAHWTAAWMARPPASLVGHLGAARAHLGADGSGVLGPGVVVGDDDVVGPLGRGGAHRPALPPVAVAARPEDDDEAARRRRTQGPKCGLDRIRSMRVVHDAARVALRVGVGPGDDLHPTGHHGLPSQRLGSLVQGVPELHQADRRERRVDDVEVAGQVAPEVHRAGRSRQREHRPVPVPDDPVRPRSEVRPQRDDGDLRLPREADAPLVVHADDAALRVLGREERRFGAEVVRHRLVEVEMVLGQVGEQRDVEDGAVDAVLGEGVAGDLHHHVDGARLAHDREQGVQVGRLGRGAHRRDTGVAHPGLDGSEQPGRLAQRAQGGLHEVCRGGLAVRPGDPDEGELPRGVTVDQVGDVAEHRSRVVDQKHRDAEVAGQVVAGPVGQHGDGAGADRLRRERAAVHHETGQRGIQVTGVDGARVEAHAADPGSLAAGRQRRTDEAGHVPQGHRRDRRWTGGRHGGEATGCASSHRSGPPGRWGPTPRRPS